jgi:hypothetical protein
VLGWFLKEDTSGFFHNLSNSSFSSCIILGCITILVEIIFRRYKITLMKLK